MTEGENSPGPCTPEAVAQAAANAVRAQLTSRGFGHVLDEIEAREEAETEQLALDRDEARACLTAWRIDPDNDADIRAAFEAMFQGYVAHLLGEPDGVTPEAYWSLVYAIRAAKGFVRWPLDWPGPHVALLREPLRNLIPRKGHNADG